MLEKLSIQQEKKSINVYSDGSGTTADKPCGWAYVIVVDGDVESEGSGQITKGTNNVAELSAAIEGLDAAKSLLKKYPVSKVILISDSQLVLGYASGKYKIKAMHLTQLYCKLRQLHDRLNIECKWVKGHSGNIHNERCDALASSARTGIPIKDKKSKKNALLK